MKLKDADGWRQAQENNTDPYGKACIDVCRRVMEKLDDPTTQIDTHKLICDADKEVSAGGITGFMAGCVAAMVAGFHERGDEFRRAWNKDNQIGDEGDRANESGGVLNPALLNVRTK